MMNEVTVIKLTNTEANNALKEFKEVIEKEYKTTLSNAKIIEVALKLATELKTK